MPEQAPATVNIQEMPTAENGREESTADIVTPSGTLTVTLPARPAVIYPLSGLVYAGFGLIGWRITRWYGWIGLLAFLVAGSLWGFIHDTVGSSIFANSQFVMI